MTMKTPEQIATQIINENYEDQGAPYEYPATENLNYLLQHGEVGAADIEALLIAAIEADRAQPERDGTVHAAVIKALQDRADSDLDHAAPCERAIKWIERDPDGFWEQHAGPMLDEIEADFTLDEEN